MKHPHQKILLLFVALTVAGLTNGEAFGQKKNQKQNILVIMGQSVIRTGLSKVGVPGGKLGIQKEDPTLAELLKPLGYTTGQFGKNHLVDRIEVLQAADNFIDKAIKLDKPFFVWFNT